MSSVILTGDTSGTLTVSAPLVAGSNTLTLAAATGTLSPLVSATAQASTSGTSIDFTGIPSWAKRITVMFNGVSTSGTSNLLVQLGDSGGIETTSYLGSANTFNTSTGGTNYSTGFIFSEDVASASVSYGHMTITNISGNIWVESHTGGQSNSPSTSVGGGAKELSATLDRVRITTVNGTDTFDAGSINIMYEG
jgi:hypothetical protein